MLRDPFEDRRRLFRATASPIVKMKPEKGGGGSSRPRGGVVVPAGTVLYSNDGTNTTGWTTSGMTISTSGGVLRATRTTTSSTLAWQPLSAPMNTSKNFTIRGKVKMSYGSAYGYIHLYDSAADRYLSLPIGVTSDESNIQAGGVNLRGHFGTSFYRTRLYENFQHGTTYLDFEIRFNLVANTITYYDMSGGSAVQVGSPVSQSASAFNRMLITMGTGSASGTWLEFDELTVTEAP